jgi:putative two-component system response regulator
LADVYDALTSRRPYKAALEHEASKSLLLDISDRFDPRIMTAFLDLENEFVAIREGFSDDYGCNIADVIGADRPAAALT